MEEYFDLIAEPDKVSDPSMLDASFEQVLDDLKQHHISRIVLSPKRWISYKNEVPLSWNMVKYNKDQKDKVPDNKKGVYSFVVQPQVANHPACSFLLYIGKAEKQDLRKRFLQYFSESVRPKGGRSTIKWMLKTWSNYIWFCYAPVDDVEKISSLEEDLISALVPPMNRSFKGVLQEAISAWT